MAPGSLQPSAAEYRRLADDLTTQVGQMAKLAEAKRTPNNKIITVLNRATGWDASV